MAPIKTEDLFLSMDKRKYAEFQIPKGELYIPTAFVCSIIICNSLLCLGMCMLSEFDCVHLVNLMPFYEHEYGLSGIMLCIKILN